LTPDLGRRSSFPHVDIDYFFRLTVKLYYEIATTDTCRNSESHNYIFIVMFDNRFTPRYGGGEFRASSAACAAESAEQEKEQGCRQINGFSFELLYGAVQ